jgi:hypothetical protein
MAEITLGKKDTVETLKVNIGGESYSVPLAGSLTISEMRKFIKDEDGFAFFEKYIPKKQIESLTMDEFQALSDAWKKASAKDPGDVTVGE